MRTGRAVIAMLVACTQTAAVLAESPPNVPIPGGIVTLALGPASAPRPQVGFGDRPVLVLNRSQEWTAVLGIDLETVPGDYIVTVTQGDETPTTRVLTVRPYRYPVARRRPDPKSRPLEPTGAKPAPEQWCRYREVSDVRLPLRLPASGRLVNRFGLRITDGKRLTPPSHNIELVVDPGQQVFAPGPGTVADVAEIQGLDGDGPGGRRVLIDHGMGLVSVLQPLFEVPAHPGQEVADKTVIGRADARDLARRPVISWEVCLNGVFVDPMLLAEPQEAAAEAE